MSLLTIGADAFTNILSYLETEKLNLIPNLCKKMRFFCEVCPVKLTCPFNNMKYYRRVEEYDDTTNIFEISHGALMYYNLKQYSDFKSMILDTSLIANNNTIQLETTKELQSEFDQQILKNFLPFSGNLSETTHFSITPSRKCQLTRELLPKCQSFTLYYPDQNLDFVTMRSCFSNLSLTSLCITGLQTINDVSLQIFLDFLPESITSISFPDSSMGLVIQPDILPNLRSITTNGDMSFIGHFTDLREISCVNAYPIPSCVTKWKLCHSKWNVNNDYVEIYDLEKCLKLCEDYYKYDHITIRKVIIHTSIQENCNWIRMNIKNLNQVMDVLIEKLNATEFQFVGLGVISYKFLNNKYILTEYSCSTGDIYGFPPILVDNILNKGHGSYLLKLIVPWKITTYHLVNLDNLEYLEASVEYGCIDIMLERKIAGNVTVTHSKKMNTIKIPMRRSWLIVTFKLTESELMNFDDLDIDLDELDDSAD
jgi:hypothetical protein